MMKIIVIIIRDAWAAYSRYDEVTMGKTPGAGVSSLSNDDRILLEEECLNC